MEITYSQYSYLFNSLFTKYYPENFLLSFNLSKVVYIYLSNNGYLTQGKMPLQKCFIAQMSLSSLVLWFWLFYS